MTNRLLIAIVLSFLLVPPLVFADVITPLSYLTIPLIPIIVIVEGVVFWLLANKWLRVPTGFWKVMLVSLVANVVTSLLGTFIPLYKYAAANAAWVMVACIASILVEWAVYILFFRKSRLKRMDLFKISVIVNLVSYVPLALLMAFA